MIAFAARPRAVTFMAASLLTFQAQAASTLLVGSYKGIPGQYGTIASAVAAARPGDWILIGPGDYHEAMTLSAGVLIETHSLHLRGMDRNTVVVDGTRPGAPQCSNKLADQIIPPSGGRNGLEVYRTYGVTIENLTVCNFLSDPHASGGNQIWWNGGDGSGVIGLSTYEGGWLTASSTIAGTPTGEMPQYGIFVSNANGPGLIQYSYASNMADSAYYVGACRDCNATLNHVIAEWSALGYSGTDAGGRLKLINSEWDRNRVGIVPSSLANDDPPSPQDGSCVNDTSRSCTLINNNYVHDNNNPNTPYSLGQFGPPVGTGIEITGGRNDTIANNLVVRNGAWGILINDYPDFSAPGIPTYCQGGIINYAVPPPYNQLIGDTVPCYFQAFGNRIRSNVLQHNGFFGNVTNGDLANAALPQETNNCFSNNLDNGHTGLTTAPLNLESKNVAGVCGLPWSPDTAQEFALFEQVLCDSLGPNSGYCSGPGYPQTTQVRTIPIKQEPGLTNPCAGAPSNAWCPAQ